MQDPTSIDTGAAPKRADGISPSLVVLLAVACGAAVANLYYAQPLLHTISLAFGVSEGTAGLLVTITQVGYFLGLAFVVPIGDLRERRSLISGTLLITAGAMVVATFASDFTVFAGALAVVGLTSVVAQIIVPMSSSLSAEHERGRVVGTVMSGLLIGILLARTVSGLIASAFGWRTVFGFGAAAMLVLAVTLRRRLPRVLPTSNLSYGGVLASILHLIRAEPILRQRMMIGAFCFGCFSVLWTSVSFLLSGPPYNYSTAVIGVFGLAGVAGAAAATVAGRLADRGWGSQTTTATILILLLSWGILTLGKTSVAALIIGIAVLDLGAQGLHISNQSAIYTLAPDARSRLTTAYMVSYFFGGAVLSALTSILYASDGWGGVCVIGALTAAGALVTWIVTSSRLRGRSRADGRLQPARGPAR